MGQFINYKRQLAIASLNAAKYGIRLQISLSSISISNTMNIFFSSVLFDKNINQFSPYKFNQYIVVLNSNCTGQLICSSVKCHAHNSFTVCEGQRSMPVSTILTFHTENILMLKQFSFHCVDFFKVLRINTRMVFVRFVVSHLAHWKYIERYTIFLGEVHFHL